MRSSKWLIAASSLVCFILLGGVGLSMAQQAPIAYLIRTIWPLDDPWHFPQGTSREHDVAGVLGGYRSDPPHFHGGVDLPAANGTDVYTALPDDRYPLVMVRVWKSETVPPQAEPPEANDEIIMTRVWIDSDALTDQTLDWTRLNDGTNDAWYTFKYVHIQNRQIEQGDWIVINSSLTGRRPRGDGTFEYPHHLFIADVWDYTPTGSPAGDHLHFEEISYDGIANNDFTDAHIRVNPFAGMVPFDDEHFPEILAEDDGRVGVIFVQGTSTQLRGQGTYDQPYETESYNLVDIRLRARDLISNQSGGTRQVGVWAVRYKVADEGGHDIVPENTMKFTMTGSNNEERGNFRTGVGWVYDTTIENMREGDAYYWITNNYHPLQGGSDGWIDVSQSQFENGHRYKVDISVDDFGIRKVDNRYQGVPKNTVQHTIWFVKGTVTGVNRGIENLTATGGNHSITLNWYAHDFNANIYFKIYRSTDGGVTYSYVNQVLYTDTGNYSFVDNAPGYYQNYFYKIQDTEAHGWWGPVYAMPSSGAVNPPAPSPAPTITVAGVNNGSVTLRVTAGSNYASKYRVYYDTDSGAPYAYNQVFFGDTGAITGLTNGTAYYFAAKAENVSGSSNYSNQVMAVPLFKVTGVTLSPATNKLNLSWQAVTGAAGYMVYYDDGTGESSVDVGNTTSYTLGGLSNMTTYKVYVQARDANNNWSERSEPVFGTSITTSGTLGSDETWPGNGNPRRIKLTGDVTIPSGRTLTINPGTVIELTSSDDRAGGNNTSKVEIIVQGTLRALGGPSNRVSFDGGANGWPGLWYGIRFTDSSNDAGCVVKYVSIRHAIYGLDVYNASPLLDNNLISGCSDKGIYAAGSYSTISNNRISKCIDGIYISGGGPKLYYNTITDNSYTGVLISSGANPQFGWLGSYGRNVITQNGSDGVYGYYYCTVFMGQDDCTANGGLNSIFDNANHEAVMTIGSSSTAQKNFWRQGGPTTGDLLGPIDYIPYEITDPNPGRTDIGIEFNPPAGGGDMVISSSRLSPEEAGFSLEFSPDFQPSLLSTPANPAHEPVPLREKLWYAYTLVQLAQYDSALAICRRIISEYPDSLEALSAINVIRYAYRESQRPGIGDALSQVTSLHRQKEVGGVAQLFLAQSLEEQGQARAAIGVLQSLTHGFADAPLERIALFEQIRIYIQTLQSRDQALRVFSQLQQKYPDDDLVRQALLLLKNFQPGSAPSPEGSLEKNVTASKVTTGPTAFALTQNYPNPFNPSTEIRFELPEAADVMLVVYNVLGEQVKTLVDERREAGRYSIRWDGRDAEGRALPSGVYLYRLKAGTFTDTKKMLLVR